MLEGNTLQFEMQCIKEQCEETIFHRKQSHHALSNFTNRWKNTEKRDIFMNALTNYRKNMWLTRQYIILKPNH